MTKAAQGLVGKKVGDTTILSAADDMSPEAMASRLTRNMNLADDDARSATGDPSTAQKFYLPYNALWYYDHHQDVQDISTDTSVPFDQGVATTAVISPQNDPKRTELPGTRRISEIASGILPDVKITPNAASHATGIQTRAEARNKDRQLNPVTVPVGNQRLDQLNSEQVALLGSISGSVFHNNPKQGVTSSQAAAWNMQVPEGSNFPKGERVHSDLAALRPLGGIRNREAVTRGLKFARGEAKWDDTMKKATAKNVPTNRVDQPGKITSYVQSIAAADKFGRDIESYNHLTRLYGVSDMQYKLPFSDVESAPRDFWGKEEVLDIVYDKPKAGKPGASLWDSSLKRSPEVDMADISIDNATHAVINEGGRLANLPRPQTKHSDQGIGWGVTREMQTHGRRAAPELADEAPTADFLKERPRITGTGYRSQPVELTRKQRVDPNQLSFDF
jgi:hypothetical protein